MTAGPPVEGGGGRIFYLGNLPSLSFIITFPKSKYILEDVQYSVLFFPVLFCLFSFVWCLFCLGRELHSYEDSVLMEHRPVRIRRLGWFLIELLKDLKLKQNIVSKLTKKLWELIRKWFLKSLLKDLQLKQNVTSRLTNIDQSWPTPYVYWPTNINNAGE